MSPKTPDSKPPGFGKDSQDQDNPFSDELIQEALKDELGDIVDVDLTEVPGCLYNLWKHRDSFSTDMAGECVYNLALYMIKRGRKPQTVAKLLREWVKSKPNICAFSDLSIAEEVENASNSDIDITCKTLCKTKIADIGKYCKECNDFRKEWPNTLKRTDEFGKREVRREKLPVINVSKKSANMISELALPALVAANNPPFIFSKHGSLVRIVTEDEGGYRIETIGEKKLPSYLSRSAQYVKTGERKKIPCDPPKAVVQDILSMTRWPGIKPLKGVIDGPVMRPDGTILTTLGYDDATGLYYAGERELKLSVPEKPTKKDAYKAARWLKEQIFHDFPYKGEADIANVLAHLITRVIRPMIDGPIPIMMFDKPQPGTGASLQVEIIERIVTGKPAVFRAMPTTEEEMNKSITAMLLVGKTICNFENITTPIKQPSLSQAASSTEWGARILGQSLDKTLSQTLIFTCNGNALEVGGDISRRAYRATVDADMSRPWQGREFKHPKILPWVNKHRSLALTKIFTMVRAWMINGHLPGETKRLGGYEVWTPIISGVLEYSGVHGFMENAKELWDEADQENAMWDLFLGEWQTLKGEAAITTKELIDLLTSPLLTNGKILETMPEDIANIINSKDRSVSRLSYALRAHKNKVYPSGRKLTVAPKGHDNIAKWVIGKSKNNMRFARDGDDN
jgi:hypothetical protein